MFTLSSNELYAMELLTEAGGALFEHFSPIYVHEVTPLKAGSNLLDLKFYHMNYGAGTEDKSYRLRVLRRTDHYVVCDRVSDGGVDSGGVVIIKDLTVDWIRKHFPDLAWGGRTTEQILHDFLPDQAR